MLEGIKKLYGILERRSTKARETVRAQQTNTEGGSESSIGSMVSGSNEKKIPDPWYN